MSALDPLLRDDDHGELAARYAEQMRDGLRRLRSSRTVERRAQLRVATRRAVIGVLTHSSERDDLKLAGEVLQMLEVERHAERMRRDAELLRSHGATVSDRHIATASTELGERTASLELHERDVKRRQAGLEGL